MKKSYKLMDLDCANCARKMQEAILKIDGVEEAEVNFMAQKLTLKAPDDRYDEILKAAIKACRRIEPDCEILI